MKILELNFEKSWRGGERQTLYTLQGFRDAGIDADLVCRKGSPMEQKAKEDGFAVYGFSSVFGVMRFLIAKGSRYNFIHAQTSHILTWCVLTKPFHHAKVFFTRRVNFVQKGFFTKLKYTFTNTIIAISPAVKKTLTAFCGRTDIEIISDIVVKSEANKSRASAILAPLNDGSKFIIGTAAALTYEKDPFTMIEAVKKMADKRKDFIFLHFGDGNLKEDVRKKIETYNLQDTYHLMGFVEYVEDIFPSLEVFVITSKEEGLGSSVLDAFINKVPVVSTNAGGLNDLLQNDRGILCGIEDSDAVAEGINSLLNDKAKSNLYTANAYEYVCNYHSKAFITGKYIQLMRS